MNNSVFKMLFTYWFYNIIGLVIDISNLQAYCAVFDTMASSFSSLMYVMFVLVVIATISAVYKLTYCKFLLLANYVILISTYDVIKTNRLSPYISFGMYYITGLATLALQLTSLTPIFNSAAVWLTVDFSYSTILFSVCWSYVCYFSFGFFVYRNLWLTWLENFMDFFHYKWPGLKLFGIAVGIRIWYFAVMPLIPSLFPEYDTGIMTYVSIILTSCWIVSFTYLLMFAIYYLPRKCQVLFMHPDAVFNAVIFSLSAYSLLWVWAEMFSVETYACGRCRAIKKASEAFYNCFSEAATGNINCHNAKHFYHLATMPDVMRYHTNHNIHGINFVHKFTTHYKSFILQGCHEFPALLQAFNKDISHAANENGPILWTAKALGLPFLNKVYTSNIRGGPDAVSPNGDIILQSKIHLGHNVCDDNKMMSASQIKSKVNSVMPNLVTGTTHIVVTVPGETENQVANGVKLSNGMRLLVINRDVYFDPTFANKQFDLLNSMYSSPQDFKEAQAQAESTTLAKLGFTPTKKDPYEHKSEPKY